MEDLKSRDLNHFFEQNAKSWAYRALQTYRQAGSRLVSRLPNSYMMYKSLQGQVSVESFDKNEISA